MVRDNKRGGVLTAIDQQSREVHEVASQVRTGRTVHVVRAFFRRIRRGRSCLAQAAGGRGKAATTTSLTATASTAIYMCCESHHHLRPISQPTAAAIAQPIHGVALHSRPCLVTTANTTHIENIHRELITGFDPADAHLRALKHVNTAYWHALADVWPDIVTQLERAGGVVEGEVRV